MFFGSVPVSTSCGQPVSSRVWYANYVCGVLSSLSRACWVPGHPVLVLHPKSMHFSNRAMSFAEKESDLPHPLGEVPLLRLGSQAPWATTAPWGLQHQREEGGHLPLPQDLSTAELTSVLCCVQAGRYQTKKRMVDLPRVALRVLVFLAELPGAGRPRFSDSCDVHPSRFQSCVQ